MVNEYNNGRPDEFKGANTFDLFSIHMMREIINLNPSDETREVALEFIDFVKKNNKILHSVEGSLE